MHIYLTDEVKEALAISRSLKRASKLVMQGGFRYLYNREGDEICDEKLRYRVLPLSNRDFKKIETIELKIATIFSSLYRWRD